jgi:hypothetical protein
VGDEVTFESYAPDQFEPLFTTGDAGSPAGPEVTLTITGILRVPDFLSESVGSFTPRALVTAAFLDEHGGEIAVYPGGVAVRLRNGAADIPAVADAVRAIFPDDTELELTPASDLTERIDDSLDVLAIGLLLCALLAAAAGVVVLGQSLSRHLAREGSEERNLAALGMRRRERSASLIAAALPVAVGGALLAGAAAIAASPLMPVGLARKAEPDRGVSVDAAVLGTGMAAIVLTVVALAALAAWTATGARQTDGAVESSARTRTSAAQRIVARAGLAPPAVIGVGMALDPGRRGPTATPVRSSLAGIAFGIAGVAAVMVFAVSMGTLIDSPQRFGYPWHGLVAGFQGGLPDEVGAELLDDPEVAAMAKMTTSLAHIGQTDVNIHAFVTLKGDAEPTLLEGALPSEAREVALGSATMREVDVSIGDKVVMVGPETVELTVVGRMAFPIIDDRSALDRGAALTPDGLEPLASQESLNDDLLVTWAPGVEVEAANEQLAERTGAEVSGLRPPSEVNNLDLVRSMPRAMVAVLAVFAMLATAHALATTVRRRRHDLAVLRSIGFVGRQLAATIAVQATALAAAGLLVGVPLGIVGGRLAWRAVADGIGVVDHPETPALALAACVAIALVVVNLAALHPSSRARRIPPATILRSG